MRREGVFRHACKRRLDAAIHAARSTVPARECVLEAYDTLLLQVRRHSTLFAATDSPGDDRIRFNTGLLALALHSEDWVRPAETWTTDQRSPWLQFASLAEHLLARYPVPMFLTSVWFDPPLGAVLRQHNWYKHIASGGSVLTAGLPVRLTRAMAHQFAQAPAHLTVSEALRWAQILGLGGSKELARAVISSRLGKAVGDNEEFWKTLLQFLVRNPSLDLAQVGPICDFLQHQKFEWWEGVASDGRFGKHPPPRPDYSLTGRTVRSLLRQIEAWHEELGVQRSLPGVSWSRSPYRGLQWIEPDPSNERERVWSITELLTGQELFEEGRDLHHCVATYVACCRSRQAAIWSLRLENQRGRFRVATIEVDLRARAIRQARGSRNRLCTKGELDIIERWAGEQGLRIVDGVRGALSSRP